jgi:ribonuclease E
MLIDTGHPEETRVVVLDGTRLEEFDVETSTKKQIKGNVYLAKVVRVEPSLQAAFVEYGGNRHGFLAFSEIHPDYYQIPVADRQALIAEQRERQQAAEAEEERRVEDDPDDGEQGDDRETDDEGRGGASEDRNGDGGADHVEDVGGEETVAAASPQLQANALRNYKIQEVIKRRQILLVQAVKEERGNKGAALTTYLSLAGRYCVFMPNTARGGGVSRKISSQTDRRRLKNILADLQGPPGGSVILRTAGGERSKAEIKRDFEYLMRQWEQIKETTLASVAPALIHEEANLIKRAIRDIYTRDIEEVLVDGDEGYRAAKDFMKMLTPSHARKVQPYKDQDMPLFHRFQVESQLDAMHSPTAQLRSGGTVVINQTEALVAIDVNSGRSTKERHIEETALKTNLEAADEIARQLRLRDLAGLIVIDFIDMDENRNNAAVERRLKEALKQDRARIQMSRISPFGLLEMSRQRLRPSLMETAFHACQHCHGTGVVRSIESTAIQMLRVIEEEGVRRRSAEVTLTVPTPVALYILNNKRAMLTAIEARYDFRVLIQGDDDLIIPAYTMDRVRSDARADAGEAERVVAPSEAVVTPPVETDAETISDDDSRDDEDANGRGSRKKRRRRRKPRRDTDRSGAEDQGEGEGAEETDSQDMSDDDSQDSSQADEDGPQSEDEDGARSSRSRRSRRRRGGRRNRRADTDSANGDAGDAGDAGETGDGDEPGGTANDNTAVEAANGFGSGDDGADAPEDTETEEEAVTASDDAEVAPEADPAEGAADADADADADAETAPAETQSESEVSDEASSNRRGWWRR